ncbi:hypothetical protein M407DRAFT_75351 [Tulasnella calospora MUT 4182]|uniref:type I protein arginine methyltransferase n=1 Tax=Tulasnella calospora MUT 4182 TaxID=1051891 RepID=A0A0C3LWG1_9AGAM|nr:hypothetical protein M407DRAFT_75351 [Tulasnella calospora MUT 4182]
MSVHIPASAISATYEEDDISRSSDASEEDNKELETFDDWIEEERPCKSLFDDNVLDSVTLAIEYDSKTHAFDIGTVSKRLGLDFLQRARLINYIRKEKRLAPELANLTGKEPFLSDDALLKPTLEDDPLLELELPGDSDDSDDEVPGGGTTTEPAKEKSLVKKVKKLEAQLKEAREAVQQMRQLVQGRLNLLEPDSEAVAPPAPRDDDSHYFNSYAYNDIHATMIQDTVRTTSYSKFILSNPMIFRGAVVMDVGCGTGILSMFAARAGARKVIAIDASDVVTKAKQNIKDNGFEDVITVIRGKVENLESLPDDLPYVDVIISEWMGYCCIYESMLDSVIVARDKFLRKAGTAGLMAPSQCRMMMSLGETFDVIRERVKFWDDVCGFKMSAMAEEVYDEAVSEVVKEECMLGEAITIKDIPVQHIAIRQLDFVSQFTLTTTRSGELNSFIVYFDTFFTTDGKDLDVDAKVELHKAPIPPVGILSPPVRRPSLRARSASRRESTTGLPKSVSFSTGPRSMPTHWKQTVFLLREPIRVRKGTTISGTFHCKKSPDNSRELDVEIHYMVDDPSFSKDPADEEGTPKEMIVQMFKVR